MARTPFVVSRRIAGLTGLIMGLTGCAAQFSGTLEGERVPDFATAAFGAVRGFQGTSESLLVVGMLMPKDSCDDGAEVFALQRRGAQASTQSEANQVRRQFEDFLEERVREDSWYGTLFFQSADDDSINDSTIRIGGNAEESLGFNLCRRGNRPSEFSVSGSGNGDDCYSATHGRVAVSRDVGTAHDVISVSSDDGPLTFTEIGGADEDSLDVSMTFSRCDALDEQLERLLALNR